MESMYFIIPVSIVFVVVAIGFYIWAVKGGQYDDLDTEGQRILFDEEPATTNQPNVQNSATPGHQGTTSEISETGERP